jgi:hypothetical protein
MANHIICDNGINREMTDEEEAQYQKDLGNNTLSDTPIVNRVDNLEETVDIVMTDILPGVI